MIDFTTPTPLRDAVKSLGERTPLGVALSSRELELLPVELRDRAFFSAFVENERILVEMQRRLLQRVKLERSKLADGSEGVTMDRARFIAEMQEELDRAGYRPNPKDAGGLQDLSSAGRLGLIWDMNLAQAQGYAKWKTGQDPDILNAAPAQELIRVEARHERRDWPAIWAAHGGKFYGGPGSNPDYPDAPGRMIALKTDPIWAAISRFGTPWPPFEWGSGMGLRNVRRKEAQQLGVIQPKQRIEPLSVPFNRGLKASVKGLPEVSIERLRGTFGDAVKLTPDEAIWQRDMGDSNPHRAVDIVEELRARITTLTAAVEGALVSARFPSKSLIAGSAQLAAEVATGQLPSLELDGGDEAESLAEALLKVLTLVKVVVKAGKVFLWRPDLSPTPRGLEVKP
jgi:hypothetical protein